MFQLNKKYFGTDGIRGKANVFPITASMALKVAQAISVKIFNDDRAGKKVLIGRDTRISGDMIESALIAGFTSMGIDVEVVGIMPTPAVARMTVYSKADLGVMITASHNPYDDNGIKFFGPDGYKFSDEFELEVEALIDSNLDDKSCAPNSLGKTIYLENIEHCYTDALKKSVSGTDFKNIKVVLDCANGAGYKIAPAVLRELGIDVVAINSMPTGTNINEECGATHVEHMRNCVRRINADIGLALDGDADRLIVCDEQGKVIDGDQIMALVAKSWKSQSLLKGNAMVATIMSNMGMEKMLESIGVKMYRSKVGDRYVLEKMRELNLNLGGEQSGHIVLTDYSTTGDGLMSALQVLKVLAENSDKPASEICKVFSPMPQIMKSVKYQNDMSPENDNFKKAVEEQEKRMAGTGRIIIRKSGTEPVIRIMAEGNDEKLVKDVVETLCNFVELNGK